MFEHWQASRKKFPKQKVVQGKGLTNLVPRKIFASRKARRGCVPGRGEKRKNSFSSSPSGSPKRRPHGHYDSRPTLDSNYQGEMITEGIGHGAIQITLSGPSPSLFLWNSKRTAVITKTREIIPPTSQGSVNAAS